ncbi:hypothetical protein PYH37_001627 [Sinorhizobium numidicum]|uniref:Anti-sigma factor NepR domain-containing protein n=1 Tax=Sinorhizobium numidicum TaxID=680248 RepID=A0ABY8CNJ0_9HYPH|nr:hypothetical protein [Sinorhizobium numidicum]WEX74236.1 hypothetical protein PYH37_001627 [Sinorhizobium numidicum]WEX80221.1 hypothetical protein PYH38_001628 [Sinorhizobium numidicum]
MSETKPSADAGADKALDERIASLLREIQKEAVPRRLLELARELQGALNARKR